MDPVIVDILYTRLDELDKLSPAQLAAVVAALKAYDVPAAAEWRDDLVKAIEAKDWYTAGLGAMSIVSGQLSLKKCP